MRPLAILYVGPNEGTSRQRFKALRRLGHAVVMIDPFEAVSKNPYVRSWVFHTGAVGYERHVEAFIRGRLTEPTQVFCSAERRLAFDLALVDSGELLGPAAVELLRTRAGVVVNYNQDNPYVPGGRFRLLRKALPSYDLIVTSRDSSVAAAKALGARAALRTMLAADEVVHRPLLLTGKDAARYGSEVAFVGAWMRGRGAFLRRVIECGVPLQIFGPRWQKSSEHRFLKPYLRQVELLGDEPYVKAIAGAKIALGLLAKENLDLHTTRSLEIPAIGTLFCAKRTVDHMALYQDGKEAVFWETPEECAKLCHDLLRNPGRRNYIAAAGHARAMHNGNFNEKLLTRIIDAALC